MSSPPSCRILTISSSVAQAKQLSTRIIATSQSTIPTTSSQSSDNTNHLPWTISNKYYTANVHFFFAQTIKVGIQDAAEAPACVFVFNPTENFQDDFRDLTKRLGELDFEVSIAISVPSAAADKQDDFERFFGEHGFEYVDDTSNKEFTEENDEDEMEGVPGIGRIIDALSTILWPSMVQKSGKRAKMCSMVSVPGPPGEEEGLRSLLNANKDPTEGTTALQREMDALEQWLEEGADGEKDSWTGMGQYQPVSATSILKDSRPAESGFDDNFSDFVSASNPSQSFLDANSDHLFPSQEDVASMSERLREIGMSEVNAEEGNSQPPFDLSRILAALDAMKEEIAGITDEEKKRKAAAKVALGLVYGLGEE